MNTHSKIQSIDQKIADLKKRKTQIARQHLQAQARLIEKCGLADLTPEQLVGALLDIKQQSSQKKEDWQCAGEMFLRPERSAKTQESVHPNAEN